MQAIVVVAGRDHDHEIERRHHIEPLAAQADAGYPGQFAAVAEGAAEPPLIAVEEQPLAVDARLDRLGRPTCRDDLLAVPLAVRHQQEAELGGVARPQVQAAEGAELAAHAGIQPFEVGCVDRQEELFSGIVAQAAAGRAHQSLAQERRAAARIGVDRARRPGDGLREDVAERVGRRDHRRFVVVRVLPRQVFSPGQPGRHGEQVAEGDARLLGRLEVGVVGEGIEYRGVERRELAFVQRDADQQGGDALGDRAQVVLRLGAVGDAAELVAPALVLAREVALHDKLAVAHHHDGMDVGLGPLCDESVELAELRRIETDFRLTGDAPAIVQNDGRAADFRVLSRRRQRERQQRQQQHERLCHPGLAYVVQEGGQAHASVFA